MANKELTFRLKFVTEGGDVVRQEATTISDIQKSISDLQKEIDNTDLGSDLWKEYNENLKESKDALEQAKTSTMGLTERLSAIPGPIGAAVQGFKGIGTAIKTVQAAMGPWGLALAAIATVLTAIGKAFLSTKEGGEKFAQVTAGLNAVMDVFRDVLVKIGGVLVGLFTNPIEGLKTFGKLIVDQVINRFTGMLELIPSIGKAIGLLFKGEFAEAGKVATNAIGKVVLGVEDTVGTLQEFGKAVGEVVKEAVNEGKKAAAIEKTLQRIADAQRQLNIDRAEQNKIINEAKLLVNDEAKSYEERIAALEKAGKLEVELANREAALAKQRADAIKAQNALSDSSAEALDRQAQAEIEYQNALAASAAKLKEVNDQRKSLLDRQRAEEKATNDAIAALRKEFANQVVETERERLNRENQLRLDDQLKQIDKLKINEEEKNKLKEEALISFNQKKEAIQKDQDQKDLVKAREQAIKEFDERLKIEQLNLEASVEGSLEQFDQKRQILEINLEKELKMFEGNEEAQTAIREKYAKLRNQIDREEQKAKLDAYNAVLGAIANLAGEETAIGKAAAIAQNLISTYSAASDIFNKIQGTLPPPVGQILGGIAAAITVAAGIKQGLKIAGINTNLGTPKQEKLATGGFISGSGAGDVVPALLSPGESVINARSTSMFGGVLESINLLGGGSRFTGMPAQDATTQTQTALMSSMAQGSKQPIKTYVLTSEVSSAQEFERKVVNRSTL